MGAADLEINDFNDIVVRDDADAEELAAHHLGAKDLQGLKRAADGHTILIPQPNDDEKNPLNWSMRKKWLVLLSVSLASVLPDYGSATGAVTLVPQGIDWGLEANYVNHSQAGNVIMLGIGGLFAVVGSNAYGRLPSLFWMLVLSVVFAIMCAAATDFKVFMAARILNGFFSAPAQATGMMFIKDIFFFHEHVRKTNLWSAFFILSPYIGPVIAAAVLSAKPMDVKLWHWSFGEFAILSGLSTILVVIFTDESWYNRRVPVALQPERGSRFARLTGIGRPGPNTRYTLREATERLIYTLFKLPVAIVCLSFGLTFAWVVGINTTLPLFLTPPVPVGYGFGVKQISLFYLTPVTAVTIGEIIGHYVNYWIQQFFIRRHGTWVPEWRLWVNWVAMPLMIGGLVLLGYALERKFHYMFVSLGWGLFVCGIMIATTGYYQYLMDCYPADAGEVSAWINLFRVVGGFIISYFMVDFVTANGAIKAFGILAGLTAGGFALIPFLQIFGARFRKMSGPVPHKDPSKGFALANEATGPEVNILQSKGGESELVEKV